MYKKEQIQEGFVMHLKTAWLQLLKTLMPYDKAYLYYWQIKDQTEIAFSPLRRAYSKYYWLVTALEGRKENTEKKLFGFQINDGIDFFNFL